MSVNCLVFGSYMASCRPLRFSGNNFAEGWLDLSLQYAGLSGGRMADVNHTRPCSSNMGLCMLAWLSQIASPPQYAEGCSGLSGPGVFGSRTGIFTCVARLCAGSRTGTESVLSSGDPYSIPLALSEGFRLSVEISSCRYALGLAQSHSVMTTLRSTPCGLGGAGGNSPARSEERRVGK